MAARSSREGVVPLIRSRVLGAFLALVLGMLALPWGPVTRAQTTNDCSDPSATTPEASGPTDISAVSGNQRLSVAVNQDATVTVFKFATARATIESGGNVFAGVLRLMTSRRCLAR